MNQFKKMALIILTVIISLPTLPAKAAVPAQSDDSGNFTYADCNRIDDQGKDISTELEKIALGILSEEHASWNIASIVEQEWYNLNLDGVLDRQVEAAIQKRFDDDGYWARFWSGWSKGAAEEMTTKVVNDSFGSHEFSKKLNELSLAVTAQLTVDLEATLVAAASATFLCMRAYAADKYSRNLVGTFEQKISHSVSDAEIVSPDGIGPSVPELPVAALGGAGVLVVTQLSKRIGTKIAGKIANRVSSRVATRVLGRLGSGAIPVVGWVIGLGLIAWDLWQGGKGALPQIQEDLQSEAIKSTVRKEISTAVHNGLAEEMPDIATEIATTFIDEWKAFCDSRRYLCMVASENHIFQNLLDDTPLDEIASLENLLNVYMDNLGRADLDQALYNGNFTKILPLSDMGLELLRDTESTEKVLAWVELANDDLARVVAQGLHRAYDPEELDEQSLYKLFSDSILIPTATISADSSSDISGAARTDNSTAMQSDSPFPTRTVVFIALMLAVIALGVVQWRRKYHY